MKRSTLALIISLSLLQLFANAAVSQATDPLATPIPRGHECTGRPKLCENGLTCAGYPYKKTCVVPKPAGMQCRIEPFWVCKSHLVCESDVCKIPQGFECTKTPNQCAKGLRCAGQPYKKTCVVPKPPGMQCEKEPFWVCQKDLLCQNHTCKIPQGHECTKTPNQCAKGLRCAGHPYRKTCVVPKPPGMQCEKEPFWVCQKELVCEKHTCKIPRGHECTKTPNQCAKGLRCAGHPYKKTCVVPKPPGMQCQKEPFWVCQKDLLCQDHTCKIPQGHECTKTPDQCAKGLRCAGHPYKKTCVVPKPPGMQCEKEPFWVCQRDLVCEQHTCKVPRGGACSTTPSQCARGLVCAGSTGEKKCVPPRDVGKKCGDADPECRAGLRCQHGACKIPEGGSCAARYEHRQHCAAGLTCAIGACKRAEGTRCKRNRQCAHGLNCLSGRRRGAGKGDRKKRCGLPMRPVAHGGFQMKSCSSDADCNGDDDDDGTQICQHGQCRLQRGAACTPARKRKAHSYAVGKSSPCVAGLLCRRVYGRFMCAPARRRRLGHRCSEHYACRPGLACDAGRCRFPLGATCARGPYMCVGGAACVGKRKRAVCKRVAHTCGKNAGDGAPKRCPKGYKCRRGACVEKKRDD